MPEDFVTKMQKNPNIDTSKLVLSTGPVGGNPLLDKFNGRRSTPDSEALASSEDEADRFEHHPAIPHQQKPTRRASWLNDTTPTSSQPRKNSFASMSPTTSHPSTPSGEPGSTWGTHSQGGVGRGLSGASSFPWGTGIWNNDTRKEPPSRLTEVLASPTSIHPPGNGFFGGDSGVQRDANQTIPFAIPLHPTPKTYRSQSYSVGQLDPDSPASSSSSALLFSGRGRPAQAQHSALHHRPSRPSMLSEMSNEGGLSKLKEVDDDDDESTSDSAQGAQIQSNEAKTIELLARENAILRQQQQQQQQYQNSRIRPRSSTTNAFSSYNLQEPVPEESDYAIDELDEANGLQDMASKNGFLSRRLSEYGAGPRVSPYVTLENRNLENVKKAYWQSSLGFGGLEEIPQSRRHSFADVPTRQGSISSAGEPLSAHESGLQDTMSPKDYSNRYQETTGFEHAASYFGGPSSLSRNVDSYSNYPPAGYPSHGIPGQFGGRPASPHRGMYGVPQPRHNQLLYIVLFKCSRADVFYVQEGTGLSVKPGDLVIVEADRGTDLGTVARDNVEWSTAAYWKEYYAEEHYKWLMMYSQGAAGTADGTGAGLMAASNGQQGSAIGGMGPPTQHGMQEPNPGEIKPKIIKRLAQHHEIQALREKEGNEAKAKRVCMQKVKEHGLHMEILDAEFQMDWKKLTFFYFADAYINFNSLVTDLFKVYKTRIWMSAINPASFASPSLGLQAPSGIGPGAIGVRTTQNENQRRPENPSTYNPAGRGYGFSQQASQAPFGPVTSLSPLGGERGMPPAFQPGYTYNNLYTPFNPAAPRNANVSPTTYGGVMDSGAFNSIGLSSAGDYQNLPARFPSPRTSTANEAEFGRQSAGESRDWIKGFQGLSMGSR